MNKSIFELNTVLNDGGYTETAVTKANQLLTDIMVKGHHVTNGIIITARNVKPTFKVNEKSLRVYLETNPGQVRDEVIISHPSNTFAGCNPDNIAVGNHRVFKTPLFERDKYPEIKNLEKYTVII
jgi:hypothetical protein